MFVVPFLLIGVAFGLDNLKNCDDGVQCITVTPNLPSAGTKYTFDCRMVEGTDDGGIPVFLLHGFPEWSHMYVPLMKYLGEQGLTSYACNQRGYSPTAAPDDV